MIKKTLFEYLEKWTICEQDINQMKKLYIIMFYKENALLKGGKCENIDKRF